MENSIGLKGLSTPGGGGDGILIFSYKCRLGSFFGVQNFEFQYFWGFQKNIYFWGYEDMHFRVRYRMGDMFLGC